MTSLNHRKRSSTCICVIQDKRKKIWVGADRRSSWSWSKAQAMDRPKVLKKDNGIILAGTGDGNLCHLLVDILDPPDVDDDISADTYIHWKLYPAIKKLLGQKGYVDEHGSLKIPGDSGCELVTVVRGQCYSILIFNPDTFNQNPNGLIAIDTISLPYTTGCGGEHAKGAIDILKMQDIKDSKLILTMAIKVAALNSPGCDDVCDVEHE